jgi:hypothetical protein
MKNGLKIGKRIYQLKLNNEEKMVIEKIHSISNIGKDSVQNVFESFLFTVILDYLDGDSTYLPFIGKISIDKGKLSLDIDINDLIKVNITQMDSGYESDIEKTFKSKMKSLLTEYIHEPSN